MPLSMLENLKLLLATKGIDAKTSDAMLNDVLTLVRYLAGMFRSILFRNTAQEIAALTSSVEKLLTIAKSGSAAISPEVADDLESLALEILERVDDIVAEQAKDSDGDNSEGIEGESAESDVGDPAISSPPARA